MTNIMSWNDALNKYNLNFDVQKVPLLFRDETGLVQSAPNLYGMQRQDNMELLKGVAVAKSYEIIQTSSYEDIGNHVTNNTDAEFTKGGVMGKGRLVYLQAKLPDSIRVKGTNDVINSYITFINSFDGSSAFRMLINGVRMFCTNQIPMFTRQAKRRGLSIRHTKNAQERLDDAGDMILEANNLVRTFQVEVDWLASQAFTDAQMALLSRKLFNVEGKSDEDMPTRTLNNIAKIQECFEAGQGVEMWRGTAWAAHNAVTEYYNHHRSLRATTDKFENNLLGTGANGMKKGINLVHQMASNP